MGGGNYVVSYVQACAGGALPLSECGPAWQMGVIAVLLVASVMALIVLRLRGHATTPTAG